MSAVILRGGAVRTVEILSSWSELGVRTTGEKARL